MTQVRMVSRPHPDNDLGFAVSKQTVPWEESSFEDVIEMTFHALSCVLTLKTKVSKSALGGFDIEVTKQTLSDKYGLMEMQKRKLLVYSILENHGWRAL